MEQCTHQASSKMQWEKVTTTRWKMLKSVRKIYFNHKTLRKKKDSWMQEARRVQRRSNQLTEQTRRFRREPKMECLVQKIISKHHWNWVLPPENSLKGPNTGAGRGRENTRLHFIASYQNRFCRRKKEILHAQHELDLKSSNIWKEIPHWNCILHWKMKRLSLRKRS